MRFNTRKASWQKGLDPNRKPISVDDLPRISHRAKAKEHNIAIAKVISRDPIAEADRSRPIVESTPRELWMKYTSTLRRFRAVQKTAYPQRNYSTAEEEFLWTAITELDEMYPYVAALVLAEDRDMHRVEDGLSEVSIANLETESVPAEIDSISSRFLPAGYISVDIDYYLGNQQEPEVTYNPEPRPQDCLVGIPAAQRHTVVWPKGLDAGVLTSDLAYAESLVAQSHIPTQCQGVLIFTVPWTDLNLLLPRTKLTILTQQPFSRS